MVDLEFARRMQERYPEGLTGVCAIGATRRTFILDQNRAAANPGQIEDFAAQGEYLLGRYFAFIEQFFGLGGQNIIITALSFRSFFERGDEYARVVVPEALRLIGDAACEQYQHLNADPYFIGLESLTILPPESPVYQMAQQFQMFQKRWVYGENRRKIVWEIATIPPLTFWRVIERMSEDERAAFNAEIAVAGGVDDLYHTLYTRFARAAYGTDIPVPQFYLGTNMSGDLKPRAPLPLALTGGDYLRMFYTPYPTLFMTETAMKVMLEDLAFGKRFHSMGTDYDGRYTPELAEAEYQRIMALSADPESTLGLSRRVAVEE